MKNPFRKRYGVRVYLASGRVGYTGFYYVLRSSAEKTRWALQRTADVLPTPNGSQRYEVFEL